MSKINLIAIVIVLIIIFCVIQSKYSDFNRLDSNTDSLKLLQSELLTLAEENSLRYINCQYSNQTGNIFVIASDTLGSFTFTLTKNSYRDLPVKIKIGRKSGQNILRICEWLFSTFDVNYVFFEDFTMHDWLLTDSNSSNQQYPRITKSLSADVMFYLAKFESLYAEIYQFNTAKEFVNKFKEELRYIDIGDEGDSLFMYYQRW